jgi:hypothetical protein
MMKKLAHKRQYTARKMSAKSAMNPFFNETLQITMPMSANENPEWLLQFLGLGR